MTGSRSAYTRQRILEAAVRLFAVKGDNTSLRAITTEAEVNLSAVNYHFGSREGLICAIYRHQIEAIIQAQLDLLEQLEAEVGDGPAPLGKLVDAYFRPIIQRTFPPKMSPQGYDPNALLRTLFMKEHKEVIARFQAAFSKSLPDIPEPQLIWRLLFMFTAVSCALSGTDSVSRALMGRSQSPLTPGELIDRMIPFLVGGLQAPTSDGQRMMAAPSLDAGGVPDVSHSAQ